MDMNITVIPKAMLRMAILTSGCEKLALSGDKILRAIKLSALNGENLFNLQRYQENQ